MVGACGLEDDDEGEAKRIRQMRGVQLCSTLRLSHPAKAYRIDQQEGALQPFI